MGEAQVCCHESQKAGQMESKSAIFSLFPVVFRPYVSFMLCGLPGHFPGRPLFDRVRPSTKVDGLFDGASGDIGFTRKASNTNGLQAVRQQYLLKNRIALLNFEGVPVMERLSL